MKKMNLRRDLLTEKEAPGTAKYQWIQPCPLSELVHQLMGTCCLGPGDGATLHPLFQVKHRIMEGAVAVAVEGVVQIEE